MIRNVRCSPNYHLRLNHVTGLRIGLQGVPMDIGGRT